MWSYNHTPLDNDWLRHEGVKGMKWGYHDSKPNGGRQAGEGEKKNSGGSAESEEKTDQKKEESEKTESAKRTLSGTVKKMESGEDTSGDEKPGYEKVKLKSGKYVYKLKKNSDSTNKDESDASKKSEESKESSNKDDSKSSTSKESSKSKSNSSEKKSKGEEYVKRIIEMLLEDDE